MAINESPEVAVVVAPEESTVKPVGLLVNDHVKRFAVQQLADIESISIPLSPLVRAVREELQRIVDGGVSHTLAVVAIKGRLQLKASDAVRAVYAEDEAVHIRKLEGKEEVFVVDITRLRVGPNGRLVSDRPDLLHF